MRGRQGRCSQRRLCDRTGGHPRPGPVDAGELEGVRGADSPPRSEALPATAWGWHRAESQGHSDGTRHPQTRGAGLWTPRWGPRSVSLQIPQERIPRAYCHEASALTREPSLPRAVSAACDRQLWP